MTQTVKIGTRGSKLALYQANLTKQTLEEKYPDLNFELVIIQTKGDQRLDVSLSKVGDKGFFTKEIERALLDGDIHLAVHSMKDLPTEFPEGLKLGAVLPRGEVRDALVSNDKRKLSELTEEDIIATSSTRRKAQLLKINPNFKIVDIRGNVDTRLKKWQSGYCTAMIMAGAGLTRLGYDEHISELLDPMDMPPAPAQGIIAIEIRDGDVETEKLLQAINDKNTWAMAKTEHTFLAALGGGCQVPIACFSEINEGQYKLTGTVLSPDGKKHVSGSLEGSIEQSEVSAKTLANVFMKKGAFKILEDFDDSTEK
ncbi:MAG: hydroxymethylbilane synthase [Bacteroidales bacterium]|nr:hydroxymethylbilane synthase [Bacteroidales bacterium]